MANTKKQNNERKIGMAKRLISLLLVTLMVAVGMVTTVSAEVVEINETIFERNFDTDDYLSAAQKDTMVGYKGWGNWNYETEPDGTGRMMRISAAANGNNIKQTNMIIATSKQSVGTYKVVMDFYPSIKGNYVGATHLTDNYNKNLTLPTVVTDASAVTDGKILRQWYTLEIKVELEADRITSKLTKDGTTYWSNQGHYAADLRSFVLLTDPISADSESAYIDNLVASKVTTETIAYPTEDSVTIIDKADMEQTDWENVNPEVGSIAIDFGRAMSEETLTETSVTLTTGTTTVTCLRSYADGVYTLVPQTKLASGGVEYAINISGDVKYDITGADVFVSPCSFTFKTSEDGETVINYPDYIWAEDFEDYSDTVLDGSFTRNGVATYGFKGWGYWNAANEYGYTGSGYVMNSSNKRTSNSVSFIIGGTARTAGAYKFTAKYKPSTQTDKISVSDWPNQKREFVNLLSGSYERKWYDLEVKADLDNDYVLVTIMDGETEVLKTQSAYTRDLRDFIIQTDTSDSNLVWSPDISLILDDVKIAADYGAAPAFTNANVVPYAASYAQTDLSKVSSLTDRIEISLPQQIKTSTLTKENIAIKNVTDNTDVEYSVLYNHDTLTYVMTLENALISGKSYTVTIKDLENTSGRTMTAPFVMNFTVGAKATSVILNKLTYNSVEIEKASELVPGSTVIAELDYQNSTGKDVAVHLIFAYYKGDELIKASYVKNDVKAEVQLATYKFEYPVPAAEDIAGYETVKVMMWDGFSTMMPLCGSIELKN